MSNTALVNNVYYDMNVYNATSAPLEAQINNKLLFPLLNQSDNFSVSLAKAKVPLNTIPLTRSNIPLKQLQLGFKIGTVEQTAYVRQVNATQNNFLWNCPKGSTILTKYQYNNMGVLTQISQNDLSLVVPNLIVYNFVIDDYENVFVIGSTSVATPQNTLYVISGQNLLNEMPFTFLKHIYIDRGQNLYLCDEAPVPTVYIYGMNNSIGSVSMTQKTTLTTNFAGNPLTNLIFCVADNEILVGYDNNVITLYNGSYQPQTDITETAITQLQNVANIDIDAETYILSDANEIDDLIFGTANQQIYNANNDTQIANASIISAMAITSNGYGFGVGTDNFTYVCTYPAQSYPQNWTQVNNSAGLKYLYTYQKLNLLFGTGQSNIYYGWNMNCGANPQTVPNSWSQLGEWELNAQQQVNPSTLDVQATTDKIVATGSDNNLYISTYPVYPFEMIFLNQTDAQIENNKIYGIQANNVSKLSRNFLLTNPNVEGIFKQGDRFFTSQIVNPNANLVIYDLNFNVLQNNQAFDSNMNYLTYLRTSGHFGYYNNTNIVVRKTSDLTIVQSYPLPNQQTDIQGLCDIDSTHFGAIIGNSLYVFNYTSNTPIINVAIPNDGFDLTANQSDQVNGASKVFVLANNTAPQDQIMCNQIYEITFTDNTYTTANTPTLVYTESRPNLTISYLECHEGISAIGFITANQTQTYPTNISLNYLYALGGYSSANLTTTNIPITISNTPPQSYQITKNSVYLMNSVSASHLFTQLNTGGVSVSSVCVSRSNPNRLYCTSNTNNRIYKGTIIGNNCTLSLVPQITQQYNYISDTTNDDALINSTLYLYGLQSQNLITSVALTDECGDIARNEVDYKYLVSLRRSNQVQAFYPTTLQSQWTTTLNGAYRIFSKNGSDIDAGKADIFDMSILVDAINAAFSDAATKINQATASGILQTPPVLTLNYQTGLCTLTYPSVLTQSANGILFNQGLLNYVYFPSVLDQQSGLQKLILNTQQESITQTVKSIFNFNQLDKILFRSNTIYVVGAYFGINDSNNIFFDIDVPTSDFVENIDQILYFQPNFLRTYFLKSNLPLDNIQLQLYYQYRDGTSYQLYISQGQNATVKIQFVSKF